MCDLYPKYFDLLSQICEREWFTTLQFSGKTLTLQKRKTFMNDIKNKQIQNEIFIIYKIEFTRNSSYLLNENPYKDVFEHIMLY